MEIIEESSMLFLLAGAQPFDLMARHKKREGQFHQKRLDVSVYFWGLFA